MIKNHKKKKTFTQLTARRRKTKRFFLKRNIDKAAPALGGLFFTNDYLDGKNGLVDLFFLGRGNKTFYNVTLQTTRCDYKDKVHHIARDNADKLVPVDYDAVWDRLAGKKVKGVDPYGPHEAFGGLRRLDWIDAESRVVADAGTVQVFEEVSLHYDYRYGIGLHATIDVPYLTVDTINTFIRAFLANGEKAYRIEKPISYKAAELNWDYDDSVASLVDPLENPPVNQTSD
ncbi:MAG: hypothetical protein K2Y22_13960 [Candidatus Obscuribacterales bacterium]|nr:hypothetical protein [Candidatus Obscuribacterales bacterium]